MLDKIKQQAMRQGMKLLSNPKVAQLMADPRFMQAITRGIEWKGRIQSEVDSTIRSMATLLNLATKADLDSIEHNIKQDMQQNLRDIEQRCGELERKIAE